MSTALFLVTETVQSHCSSAECWEVSHRYRIIALYKCLVLVFVSNIAGHLQQRDCKREMYTYCQGLGEQKSAQVLLSVRKAVLLTVCKTVCVR